MFAGAGGALGHPPPDSPTLDSSEQVYISSLALLKMLKHGTFFFFLDPFNFSCFVSPNVSKTLICVQEELGYPWK